MIHNPSIRAAATILLLVLITLSAGAQKLPHFPKVTPAGKGKVNTRIDNIGYWDLMARMGYVEVNPWQLTTPARERSSLLVIEGLTVQDSPDIPVTDSDATTQSENSIFIDPEDENIVVNSNNSSDWTGAYAQNQYGCDGYWTFDAGSMWGGSIFGVGQTNMGDPAAAIGRNGWWYVGKINNGRGQSVAYSTNQGQTWTDVAVAQVPGGFGDLLDKNHLWIDNSETSAYEGYLYTGWSCYVDGSPHENGIELSRSTDHGLSWAIPVCISDHVNAGAHNQGLNIQTGPNGEVYVAWIIYDTWPSDETAIGFAKSYNGGETWVPANRIITNIKGIRTSGTKKEMRVASFPVMTVDLSGGPNHGNLYIVWANIGEPGINTGTGIDIYMIRSSNQGDTWSDPIRVNQDPFGLGKQHFLPWLTCDPINGNLCAIYYDDRNVDSTEVETWVSYSWDGGNSWSDFRVSDVAFTPGPIPGMAADYFGDYIGIKAQNMKVYPIWTDNRSGHALTYVSPFTLGPPPNQPWVSYYSHETEPIPGDRSEGINFGDSLYLNLGLKNIGDQPAEELLVTVSSPSPWITLTDDTAGYGSLQPDEIKVVPHGFSFDVSDSIPDRLKIRFDILVEGSDTSWQSHFSIESHAPSLRIISLVINDATGGNNNGRLDPGETVTVTITNANRGYFHALNSYGLLSSSSPYITLHNDSVYLDTLVMGQPKTSQFSLTVADEVSSGTGIFLDYALHSRYHMQEAHYLETIGIIVEDWETGNFHKFPWQHFGNLPWTMSTTLPFEGLFCAASPTLPDYKSGILVVEYTSGIDDSISFYRKTSCEPDYDFLHFYIDDVLQGSWSGEVPWGRVAFPVSAGTHTFKWSYVKDIYMSVGQDKVWLDFIAFPPPVLPEVDAGPDDSICAGLSYQLSAYASGYDSLVWITKGDGNFSSTDILSPLYTPGAADMLAGEVKLMLRAFVQYGSTLSSMFLRINESPPVAISVEPKDTLCSWQSGELSTQPVAGASYLWTPGTFTTSSITIDTAVVGGTGTTRFRVKVTNAGGCSNTDSIDITFRDCTAIDETQNRFYLSVSPNPSYGFSELKIHTPIPETLSWKIISSGNQVILEEQQIGISGEYIRQLDLRHLASGVYILEIRRTTETVTEKIILVN